MAIKILLVLGLIAFAWIGLRNRNRAGHKALRRITLVLFGLGAIAAVTAPGAIQWVANRLGVGRGTDLVLYALVLAFLFTLVGFAARFAEQEERIVQISRKMAVNEALREYPDG